MIAAILGFLGIGGATAFGLGLLVRFGFLGFMPQVVTKVLTGIVELVLSLLGWLVTTLLQGMQNVFATWQGGFTILVVMLTSALWGHDPIVSTLHKWPSVIAGQSVTENDDSPTQTQTSTRRSRYVKPPSPPPRRESSVLDLIRKNFGVQ